jgi:hypothetical protein
MIVARLSFHERANPARFEKSPVRKFREVPQPGQRVRFLLEGRIIEAAVGHVVWISSDARDAEQCDVELRVSVVAEP